MFIQVCWNSLVCNLLKHNSPTVSERGPMLLTLLSTNQSIYVSSSPSFLLPSFSLFQTNSEKRSPTIRKICISFFLSWLTTKTHVNKNVLFLSSLLLLFCDILDFVPKLSAERSYASHPCHIESSSSHLLDQLVSKSVSTTSCHFPCGFSASLYFVYII